MSRDPQALLELYAGRALEPLDPGELSELDQLESAFGILDDGSFDRAVASVALAGVADYFEPMPDSLRRSLASAEPQAAAPVAEPIARPVRSARPIPARPRVPNGWWAAAACLVLAIFGWVRTPQGPSESAPAAPRLARENLLRSAPGVLQLAWSATEDPLNAGATGDVIWDSQTQEGYMTFRDLPVNDPSQHQYQLWIFDRTRSEEHPVDGGVFDVTATGEAIVPIHAKLDVREPSLFAVTLEPPGGVVVSRREHLLLLASVEP